ncbi:Uncharacterised protein [Legionella wadsworthii]|uniref:1,4-alpha-glucan branching enzyme n=1 Tax=Legionella wadsworthii TaxID=28088 RepID=A0A378LVK1_9GAMM|nr:hypothetical protein [Legionella wadsworthii]STY29838.1 Uncharacterised protein [Legionella wadsworthii]
MSPRTHTTSNHEEIKKWAEERKAKPSKVKGTEQDGTSLLRLDFPGYTGENLETITWNEWFEIFDKNKLALLFQEETSEGKKSNFNKIIRKEH